MSRSTRNLRGCSIWLRSLVIGAALLPLSQAMAQIKVFACEPEWAALATTLGGEHVKVYAATHARQDPHHIQARPSLIARLRNADLAVCTGAELEVGWMPMLQRRARNPKVLTGKPGFFEATDYVELLEIPGQLDRMDGDVHADGNPHVQLDPRRILTIAKALARRLQKLEPSQTAAFQQNLEAFEQRWTQAISAWENKAAPLCDRKYVVHHREWVYLMDWLGMSRAGSLEPNPGVPPTLSHLSSLRELGKTDGIIVSPLNDTRPAQWLTEQSQSPIITLPQTVGAVEDSDDLFSFFDTIIERLLNANS